MVVERAGGVASLYAAVRALLGNEYPLVGGGTGAPGRTLENLLGVDVNSDDLPDIGGWEMKFHGGSSLLTLFHLTPQPKDAIRNLVKYYGYTGKDGRQNFRHTISGGPTARGFRVVNDGRQLVVMQGEDEVAYWTEDSIVNSGATKIRRLIVVSGAADKEKGMVGFTSATAYKGFKSTSFVSAVVEGIVKIDFDARFMEAGGKSEAIRDHGTKFRVKLADLPRLYESTEQI